MCREAAEVKYQSEHLENSSCQRVLCWDCAALRYGGSHERGRGNQAVSKLAKGKRHIVSWDLYLPFESFWTFYLSTQKVFMCSFEA